MDNADTTLRIIEMLTGGAVTSALTTVAINVINRRKTNAQAEVLKANAIKTETDAAEKINSISMSMVEPLQRRIDAQSNQMDVMSDLITKGDAARVVLNQKVIGLTSQVEILTTKLHNVEIELSSTREALAQATHDLADARSARNTDQQRIVELERENTQLKNRVCDLERENLVLTAKIGVLEHDAQKPVG